jgi:sporulation protein YlmC with PRC-barrel domain
MHTPRSVLSASTLAKFKVENTAGEDLGKIEEVMIDSATGRVAYAVLSFGGFLGFGDKLFAIPWSKLSLTPVKDKTFILNVPKERLDKGRGFNKDKWPDVADPTWQSETYKYYDAEPYW